MTSKSGRSKLFKQLTLAIFFGALAVAVFEFFPVNQNAQNKSATVLHKFQTADTATSAVRDSDYDLFRIYTGNDSDTGDAREIGVVVEEYGNSSVIARRKDAGDQDENVDFVRLETTVNLPGEVFDPVADGKTSLRLSDRAVGGKDYFIVQLAAPVTDEIYRSLEESGAEVIQYVSHNAYFVYASFDDAIGLTQHSRVRWIGRYEAKQRVPSGTSEAANSLKGSSGQFDIAVFKHAELAVEYQRISEISFGIVAVEQPPVGFFDIITAELNQEQLENV